MPKLEVSHQFEKVYDTIIECDNAIATFFMKNYAFADSEEAALCKRILDLSNRLHEVAHDLEEHLAWKKTQ